MSRRIVVGPIICVILGTFAYAQAAAPSGVVTINGGRTALYLNTHSDNYTPAGNPAAGLVTIFNNLGSGGNVYNAIAGTGVLGPNVPGQPRPEWLAFAFTPTADHTVQVIAVGATYVSGTNELFLSLNDDNNGFPGNALRTWHFTNLPAFGTCCTLQVARYATGIPITQGAQYWVVLRTAASPSDDTWDVWNNDFGGQMGRFSNNLGSGWWDGGIQQQGAFGVFGQ